jgi:glucose dehydrogenase
MTNLNKIFAFLYPVAGIVFIVKMWMINSRQFSHDLFFPILIFFILACAVYFVSTTYWKLAMTSLAHGRKFMSSIGIITLICGAIIYIIDITTTEWGGIIAVPFIIIAVALLIVTFVSAIVLRIWNRKIQ